MYFMYDICTATEFDPLWNVLGVIIKVIWIGVPILLIIFGMIDLGKAVIANDEKEVQKSTKAFGKRFLYAVAVFLVVWLVRTVLSISANVVGGNVIQGQTGWEACWSKIV